MNNEHELNLRIKQLEDALEKLIDVAEQESDSVLRFGNPLNIAIDEAYNILRGGE